MTPTKNIPRRSRLKGAIRKAFLAAAVVVVGAIVVFAPTACYLTRGAWEEAKILSRRRDISAMLADPHTNPVVRAKLTVVEAARTFAHDSLGLSTGQSFTTYSHVDSDTLVLVLSAAYRDRLASYTWWFPVVGRVPYKGYFDFAAARAAARAMDEEGYDVYLRPSDAFSTLGFFPDPLLNTTLRSDSLTLANTVIHELTHNTFYAPGQVPFNESFASFVGARGSVQFFLARGDTVAARQAEARWEDEKLLGAFWSSLSHTLDSAFRAHPGDRSARLAARAAIYAHARTVLVDSIAPRLSTISPLYAERVRLDNASLLARRVYASGLGDFDLLWVRNGRDLRRTIRQIIVLAKSSPAAPFRAVTAAAIAH